ncbi:MAG: cupredoxin domain-containing protein [bacterium]|nr:cupredoxin domain-containing protein [bacterium]
MKKIIIIVILTFVLMEGVAWWAYKAFFSKDADAPVKLVEQAPVSLPSAGDTNKSEGKPQANQSNVSEEKIVPIEDAPPVAVQGKDWNAGSFPPPSTEVVNGVTERTIHIGVRQWAWDPHTLTAKQGELVRLIVHNADVKHGLVIPDLGVNQDIPEDGAVITFRATKEGAFEFLCSVYCGVGHAEMQGKIIIE